MAVKKVARKKKASKPQKSEVNKDVKKKAPSSAVKKRAVKKTAVVKAALKPAKKKEQSGPSSTVAAPKQRMSAAERKRDELLRKFLHKKRNELVEELGAQIGRKLTRETGQKIDSAMDSADQSSQDMDQGIDYSLLEMKYTQYKDIADAFRRLENSTFGLCEECGEEIDIKRLAVNPLARYCISCKTKKEEMEKIQKEETRFKE